MTQLDMLGYGVSLVQDLHCAVHAGATSGHGCNAAALERSAAKASKKAETRQVLDLTQIYQRLETHSLSSATITGNSQLMQSGARLS